MPDARIGDNIGYLTFGKNFYLKKKQLNLDELFY